MRREARSRHRHVYGVQRSCVCGGVADGRGSRDARGEQTFSIVGGSHRSSHNIVAGVLVLPPLDTYIATIVHFTLVSFSFTSSVCPHVSTVHGGGAICSGSSDHYPIFSGLQWPNLCVALVHGHASVSEEYTQYPSSCNPNNSSTACMFRIYNGSIWSSEYCCDLWGISRREVLLYTCSIGNNNWRNRPCPEPCRYVYLVPPPSSHFPAQALPYCFTHALYARPVHVFLCHPLRPMVSPTQERPRRRRDTLIVAATEGKSALCWGRPWTALMRSGPLQMQSRSVAHSSTNPLENDGPRLSTRAAFLALF